MEETIEQLREQLVKANEDNKALKTANEELTKTNKEQLDRINELTTYNNKLFTRLTFDAPKEDTPKQETEADVINRIVDKIKGGK